MVEIKDSPWTALLLISTMAFLNIMTLYIFFIGIEQFRGYPKLIGGSSAALVGLLNYWILFYSKRYASIINFYNEKFSKKPQSIISISLVVIYIIATFSLAVMVHKGYFNN